MKYFIYTRRDNKWSCLAELTPGACLENSWFFDTRLWNAETGFTRETQMINEFLVVPECNFRARVLDVEPVGAGV